MLKVRRRERASVRFECGMDESGWLGGLRECASVCAVAFESRFYHPSRHLSSENGFYGSFLEFPFLPFSTFCSFGFLFF